MGSRRRSAEVRGHSVWSGDQWSVVGQRGHSPGGEATRRVEITARRPTGRGVGRWGRVARGVEEGVGGIWGLEGRGGEGAL